jgi:hypothetical protein
MEHDFSKTLKLSFSKINKKGLPKILRGKSFFWKNVNSKH